MKSLFISIFLLLAVTAGFAQRVPSDCTAPDSIVEYYKSDAARLAFREVQSEYTDSIRIPKALNDKTMRALLAVYNAKKLSERDTVILLLNIHTKNYPAFWGFEIGIDTSFVWARNLRDSILPTGNKVIDSLMNEFGMSIDRLHKEHLTVSFQYKQPLNLKPLYEAWWGIPGIFVPLIDYDSPDGPDIFQRIHDTTITLTYSWGWEDCWNIKCKYHRYWVFTVFPDCSVQFDSSYGDQFDQTKVNPEITTNNSLYFYPNPAFDKITLEVVSPSTIDILDVEGKIMQSVLSKDETTELSVSPLPSGVYFIRATDKNGNVRSGKFVKE